MFEPLLTKNVILFCMNYFYSGKLVGYNESTVILENGGIVYETGKLDAAEWKDFQPIPGLLYVQISAIEAFALGKSNA